MILYHGTNVEFDRIDLRQSKANKDFGQGFYLTDIERQALEMAQRRVRIAGDGSPTILRYEFDERLLESGELKVLRFNEPSREWALFILNNRMASDSGFKHDYDVVIGPVADDGVVFQLNLFLNHAISEDQLVEQLTYRRLNTQYFFGTERAISKLHKL